jgi:hypothetical protein
MYWRGWCASQAGTSIVITNGFNDACQCGTEHSQDSSHSHCGKTPLTWIGRREEDGYSEESVVRGEWTGEFLNQKGAGRGLELQWELLSYGSLFGPGVRHCLSKTILHAINMWLMLFVLSTELRSPGVSQVQLEAEGSEGVAYLGRGFGSREKYS